MANASTNYAEKYADQLEQAFLRSSVIAGKVNTEYEFTGVKTIHIYSAVTQPLTNYTRSGVWRYGDPQELLTDVQDLVLSQDKSFSMTIDKGNYKDANLVLRTGRVVKQQIGEQVTPFFDKYALNKWATDAAVLTSASPTKANVVDMFVDARKNFVNNNIPMTDSCYAYIPATTYAYLLQNPEFISVEKLGEKHLSNGVVGKVANWTLVEVPDSYLPNGVFALFTHKSKVLAPSKIAELKTYNDVPGLSGSLIEGRYYGDAFVMKTLVNSTTYASNAKAGSGTFQTIGVLAAKASS
jgi:hypothetical protein